MKFSLNLWGKSKSCGNTKARFTMCNRFALIFYFRKFNLKINAKSNLSTNAIVRRVESFVLFFSIFRAVVKNGVLLKISHSHLLANSLLFCTKNSILAISLPKRPT